MNILYRIYRSLSWLAVLLTLSGCARPAPPPASTPAAISPIPVTPAAVDTPTAVLPSPTTPPLAALVNGDPITLAEYQAELGRYQAASGTELATEDQQRVFDELVDQLLLEQAAYESGFALDEAGLQQRYDALVSQLGNAQKLQEWMAANGYTQESFRQSLRRAAAAAWMRDQIAASVPLTVEQVHARQILLYNSEEAESVFAQLGAGADFAELADQYDPAAGGDLGWFPPGYLLDSKLDEAVFSLQPGAYSPIVQTGAGYHILQLLERDPQRPLEPGARLRLQFKTLNDWMATRRSQSQIQVLLP